MEIRKFNDDPYELDELILHVHKLNGVADEKLTRELNNRFVERTEIRPNRIVFHDPNEMEELLGVGTQLKEQKVIDRRSRKAAEPVESPTPCNALNPAPAPGAKVEIPS